MIELPIEDIEELKSQWSDLSEDTRKEKFFALSRPAAEELFLSLSPEEKVELLEGLAALEKRSWIRLLPLDDTADFIQRLPDREQEEALSLLDAQTGLEVRGLLAYAEDNAGGLMNPRYTRVRPDITVEAAIRYLRAQAKDMEPVHYAYVLDRQQHLMGVVSLREIFMSLPHKRVHEIMRSDPVSIPEEMDQEDVSQLFSRSRLLALPVVDKEGRMKGVVTSDDIVTVVEKEATEDIQKLGGMEALDLPYWNTPFLELIQKRAGWLVFLFVGGMLTATAMTHYEGQIEKAVVLAIFIPLLIASGGNAGSQASTLIIRSLALKEIRLQDWWRVLMREIGAGLVLGLILGFIGLLRVILWPSRESAFGDHAFAIGLTLSISLLGIVLWGAVAGSMLPFILRKLNFDPASASAPLVATLVDVTGLIIYFSVASALLTGTLL